MSKHLLPLVFIAVLLAACASPTPDTPAPAVREQLRPITIITDDGATVTVDAVGCAWLATDRVTGQMVSPKLWCFTKEYYVWAAGYWLQQFEVNSVVFAGYAETWYVEETE
jgi:hypothetical protein